MLWHRPRPTPPPSTGAETGDRTLPRRCTRLVLAGRHTISRYRLESALRREPDLQVVARCGIGDETVVTVGRYRPDVLILHMLAEEGLGVLRMLQRKHVSTRVVLIADELGEEQTLEALRLGVRAMLLTALAPHMVVPCLRKVLAGEPWFEKRALCGALDTLLRREDGERGLAGLLTPREMETVRLVAQGLRTDQLSSRLDISTGTVKTHLQHVYRKLNVKNRVALTLYAQALKLV